MVQKFVFILSVAQLFYIGRACNEGQEGQLSDVYSTNPWASAYYFNYLVPKDPILNYKDAYEGRTAIHKLQQNINPFNYYFKQNEQNDGSEKVDSRFGYSALGSSLLNSFFNNRFAPANTFRPFAGITNLLPITINPNYARPFANYESCTSPNGEAGICASGTTCNVFGGKSSGFCGLGSVCCINSIPTCRGTITLNNTYWQSPTTGVSPSSTCAITVKLDARFTEQRKPICQVRLDFISFDISQPELSSVCAKDTFQVSGASNKVPMICGENDGQHMYLEVPSSATKPTNLQLMFNFDATVTKRSWNIKIAMLPCSASYLAPADCLQYFTSSNGKVSSFNWKDVAATTTINRQLADQDYNICFRTELLDAMVASKLCVTPCESISTPPASFRVTGLATGGTSASSANYATAGVCDSDFLLIPDGSATGAPHPRDRYCGNALHPTASTTPSTTVCTTVKQFKLTYRTNKEEPVGDKGNLGFCLNFKETTE